MPNPTHLPQWQALLQHYQTMHKIPIKDLFNNDAHRFDKFSVTAANVLLDYSKNPVSNETIALLIALAKACGIKQAVLDLQAGKIANHSEQRPAMHNILRQLDSPNAEVASVLERMQKRITVIHHSPHTDIVNIGIGGSDLGPSMVSGALHKFAVTSQRLHFVSTLDAHQITATLSQLRPENTLFIISSKSFSTPDTLENMALAKQWLGEHDFNQHFIAVTANSAAAKQQGFDEDNIFPIWDWVGGRYSVWSAIGFPIAIKIGMTQFREFLSGAQAIDKHVVSAPMSENMPMILALLNIWLVNFYGYSTRAVLPYDIRLARFPAYLQQLEMESNGKSVRQSGESVSYATGPIIWGEAETNGQHAFHQLLYQGTPIVPVDFIMVKQPSHGHIEHHQLLFANCLSQARVMMIGDDAEDPHRVIPGNRPNNMLILPALTPYYLGALIALYEYKVFISATLWDINPFDQWGVELGKKIANQLYFFLQREKVDTSSDSSTQGLMQNFFTR
jgi:glucose-6-phosphate isomerase